jgi:hypothetical protein
MTITDRQRLVAIFAAVNLLILGIAWFALIAPQRHDAASAAAQQQAVSSELAALTGSSASSNKQPAINTKDLYKLDTALPAQEDQPDLLFEFDRLATAAGVTVNAVTPQPPQATNGYTVVPISLQLNGPYYHLTGFLHSLRVLVSERRGRLSANGPLFAVTSVDLTPCTSVGKGKHKTLTETANVSIATFYYGVVGGAAPPASTTATDTTTTTGG